MNIKTKPELGNRIFAGFVDYMIIFILMVGVVYLLGEPNEEGGYTLNGSPGLIPYGIWFIFTIGAEQVFGRTLGNYAADLKVLSIKEDSNKISILQSIKRHLLDPFDMMCFGIVGIVCIKSTKMNQRLGDLWADTYVKKEK